MAIDFRNDLILRAWPGAQASHVKLLQQIGVQAVLLPESTSADFKQACAAAGIGTMPESELKTFKAGAQMPADPGPYAALSTGLWPGISRGPSAGADDETASASREPWVDANGYWIAYLSALYPHAAPVLAYEADAASGLKPGRVVPFDTLTLALAEARIMGGNYILSLDAPYREGLLKEDPRAASAWKELGVTAKWLAANRALFAKPPLPTIAAIVEPGRPTAEIANLLFRRAGSPHLVSAPPPPSKDILVLVTTAMKPPKPEIAARILDHAKFGSTVVTDDPSPEAWWKVPGLQAVKTQSDRVFYLHGKGTIVAYNRKIVDPSEHALDIIDIVTHPRRPVRIWNAASVIAVATKGTLHFLNYGGGGRNRGGEIQARIQGIYRTATMLRPGEEPLKIDAAPRGGTATEVFVSDIGRIASVVFS